MTNHLICIATSVIMFCSYSVNAANYQWKSISFKHTKAWSISTDRTIKGAKVLRLRHKIIDSYPLSVMLSFIPKSSYYADTFKETNVSKNVMAANFSWPLVKRFSKETTKDNMLISFNEVLVGRQLSPGAMLMVPTPQKHIFISAQTFYVDKPNYYVVGSIISRIDKGVMRNSIDYAKRIDSAYQILKSVSVDYD